MAENYKKDVGNARSRKPDISSLVYGKVPPQAIDLEEAVLGAMLLEREAVELVLGIIDKEAVFYADPNQKVYAAIRRLFDKGMPVDLLTVMDELRRSNELELVGGAYYVSKLTKDVVSSAHTEAHARIVVEKFIQRELIRLSGEVISEAYEDSSDVFDLLDQAESNLNELHYNADKKDAVHISVIAVKNSERTEVNRKAGKLITGVRSGLTSIDEITHGWQRCDLITLAARPAVGKTSFGLCICMNAQVPCAFFSLEMDGSPLEHRMRANISNVALSKISVPASMTDEEFTRYLDATPTIAKLPIFVEEVTSLNVLQLRAKARKLKKKQNIQLIVIDYMQLMRGDKKYAGNREQEIADVARGLKSLAKELQIPIIALAQLNRESVSKGRKPRVHDIRESDAIEHASDVIALMYAASDEEQKQDPSLRGIVNFDIVKHRNGSVGDLLLQFDKPYQRWSDIQPKFTEVKKEEPPANHYKTMQQASAFNNSLPYKEDIF